MIGWNREDWYRHVVYLSALVAKLDELVCWNVSGSRRCSPLPDLLESYYQYLRCHVSKYVSEVDCRYSLAHGWLGYRCILTGSGLLRGRSGIYVLLAWHTADDNEPRRLGEVVAKYRIAYQIGLETNRIDAETSFCALCAVLRTFLGVVHSTFTKLTAAAPIWKPSRLVPRSIRVVGR